MARGTESDYEMGEKFLFCKRKTGAELPGADGCTATCVHTVPVYARYPSGHLQYLPHTVKLGPATPQPWVIVSFLLVSCGPTKAQPPESNEPCPVITALVSWLLGPWYSLVGRDLGEGRIQGPSDHSVLQALS